MSKKISLTDFKKFRNKFLKNNKNTASRNALIKNDLSFSNNGGGSTIAIWFDNIGLDDTTRKLQIYAINYNILNISNGMGGLIFSN